MSPESQYSPFSAFLGRFIWLPRVKFLNHFGGFWHREELFLCVYFRNWPNFNFWVIYEEAKMPTNHFLSNFGHKWLEKNCLSISDRILWLKNSRFYSILPFLCKIGAIQDWTELAFQTVPESLPESCYGISVGYINDNIWCLLSPKTCMRDPIIKYEFFQTSAQILLLVNFCNYLLRA